MPSISVFIPVYNAEKFVAEAIISVINQTCRDWEIIILDDSSTDNSFKVCQTYAQSDSRIKVYRNDHNLGMVGNWNKGISFCHSEYFIKLDADDRWEVTMLEKSIAILKENKNIALVFSRYANIDEHGMIVSGSETRLPEFARNKSFSCSPLVNSGADKMLQYPILRQGLSVMRRVVVDEVGNYRYLLSRKTEASSDTEFYFRVGCQHLIYCLDEVLYFYRIHKQSISASNAEEGISQLKLFEVKTVINNYYLSQHKITKQRWKTNKDQIDFSYCISLNYKSRLERNYMAFLKSTFMLLFFYPIKTLLHAKRRIMITQN